MTGPQDDLGRALSEVAADVARLRSDVAFISVVTRHLRDIAIAAHIAATNGDAELFAPPIPELSA
jgi:hypothetical protein